MSGNLIFKVYYKTDKMSSSFRPLVPQPLLACLTMEEQHFLKKHHDRVRQNHVFVYYLYLFVFGAIGLIFLYGAWALYKESKRPDDHPALRSVALFFVVVAMVFFGVCGWCVRELTIKKEINRLVQKCSR